MWASCGCLVEVAAGVLTEVMTAVLTEVMTEVMTRRRRSAPGAMTHGP